MTAGYQVVAWETTRRCDLACRHCRAAAGTAVPEGELTPEEGLRLVDALAALPAHLLILTGGEPMMRPDLCGLARAASIGGMRVVAAPCGPLLNAESAARLKEAGISAVSLSLDAATPAEHDAFRGVNGAYASALRGLRHARAAGLAVQVNTTVSRLNVHQLPALLDLAEREGAATLDFFFLVPTGRARAMKELQLDAEQIEEALHWIAEVDGTRSVRVKTTCAPQMARVRAQRGMKRQPGRPAGGCMAGRGFLFISHTGTVQPCGFLDLSCGNVRDYDFDLRSLLDASDDLRRLGALADVKGRCGTCAFLRACGGCRARAHEMLGDAMGEEPFCVGDGRGTCRVRAGRHSGPTDAERPTAGTAPTGAGAPGGDQARRIAVALQRGVPLEARPFAALAAELNMTEADVLAVARRMLAEGAARRFGAVFDARRLGYRSELCALHVPGDDVDRLGAVVSAHPGVTHCYLRGPPPGGPPVASLPGLGEAPNLWFTLSVSRDRFDREMERVQAGAAPYVTARFPAVRRFKIDVIFDENQRDAGEQVPGLGATGSDAMSDSGFEVLTEKDRALVRALAGNVPIRADFFVQPAMAMGLSVDAVLERLRAWRSSGTLRRLALIVRHQRLGFVANAMCIWPVPDDAVLAAGRRLAAWPAVTHCYQRVTSSGWPYNLYAMIHTGDWPSTRRLFDRLSADVGSDSGWMLGSLREYKKTSMNYFTE